MPVQIAGRFVFQHYAAFKHMTVRDNVAFGLDVRKKPKAEIEERVREPLASSTSRASSTATRRSSREGSASGWRSPGRCGRAEGAPPRRAVRRPRRQGP